MMSQFLLPKNAKADIRKFLVTYQDKLCLELESLDGQARFLKDAWQREEGGGGLSCVMSNGRLFESAGINFSHIHGAALPKAATQLRPELAGHAFEAMGVSIVFHPNNPFIPTTHANIRFFLAEEPGLWWFGGGFDLTPYYPFEEDCILWHQHAKTAAEQYYPSWKKNCDEYFYLPHRQETRGIGGLFFDDYNSDGFEECFRIWKNVAEHFYLAYQEIVNRRHAHPYTDEEKNFQLYRRGRYVEFNLLYDRGTMFGLQSHGRTESILMSMPPQVHFKYNWSPKEHSKEARLYERYLQAQDWLKLQ